MNPYFLQIQTIYTMSPEEKAKALIDKFEEIDNCDNHHYQQGYVCSHQAKQCAFIAVDEIIDIVNNIEGFFVPNRISSIKYWQQVKEAIQSL